MLLNLFFFVHREFQKYNFTTNVFQVSAVWLYSLYWCMGLSSVTSDKCHVLERLKEPIWHLVSMTVKKHK